MPSFEEDTHVFIVRIWREVREIEGADPEWRGVIEHLPTEDRRYVKELDEITAFIAPYLESSGITVSRVGYIRRWIERLKRSWGSRHYE